MIHIHSNEANPLAPPPIDFCSMFRSNEANQAGRNISTEGKVISEFLKLRFSCLLIVLLYSVTTRLREHLLSLVPLQPCICSICHGLPPTSQDALKRTQGYSLGKLLNPTFAITNLDLGHLFVPFPRSSILQHGKKTGVGAKEEESTADLDLLLHL
ncbi:hypothetical protein V6N12_028072 [Hibiscus sabdariffa]|uniref:Uncharacterized protein n=1 Tax=Hibiscus sabdariffa TaxID=183260 RepID=A0ABR2F4T7_9ROSI